MTRPPSHAPAAPWTADRLAAVQRRTVGTLVASQALGGLGIATGIAVASILATEITGSARLAGLAQTMQVLGAALASYLLARVMGRHGRRRGLGLGYLLGGAGGALCVLAGVVGSFATLLLGAGLLGVMTAANSLSRYAATDVAPPGQRARALSVVVWATTLGAVAGPNLVGVAGRAAERLTLPPLTGPFLLAVLAAAAAGLTVVGFLRPDPLLVAREAAATEAGAPLAGETTAGGTTAGGPVEGVTAPAMTGRWRRLLGVARTHPGVAAGVVALALSHAVMVAVMVMTPLHMHHGGAALEVIGVVVSGHVLGMFALAPVVGWAADRFGRAPVLAAGAAVQLCAVALAGSSPAGSSWAISLGLFLLGLGWSLGTVAASALLSESAPLAERTDVQGAADLVMGLVAALAGALAGLVMAELGFGALNLCAGVLALGVGAAAFAAGRVRVPRPRVER